MAKILSTELLFIAVFAVLHSSFAQDLAPPYFNIAEKKIVTVNATCGEGTITKKEVYCKLVGYDSYLHTQHQNVFRLPGTESMATLGIIFTPRLLLDNIFFEGR